MDQVKQENITRIGTFTEEDDLYFTPCNQKEEDIKINSSGMALKVGNVYYPLKWYTAIELYTNKSFKEFRKAIRNQEKLLKSLDFS